MDHRGNVVSAAEAETLWSVRVLRASSVPNCRVPPWPEKHHHCHTNLDLLWDWIKAMMKNNNSGIPFRVDPPMDKEAEARNKDPATFIAALFTGHSFKNGMDLEGRPVFGMDYYINWKLEAEAPYGAVLPSSRITTIKDRDRAVRDHAVFQQRGRVFNEMYLVRTNSFENNDAGIAAQEYLPAEAGGFFHQKLMHGGKSCNTRVDEEYAARVFAARGAPFCAGASGSIEYMVLSMEDDCGGHCPLGLVPAELLRVREALIGTMSAALVAGGQHSLGECLVVAQAMGYFAGVPSLITGYFTAVSAFEQYLARLGVGVGRGEEMPLVKLATQFRDGPA